jgi:hypothetical protein
MKPKLGLMFICFILITGCNPLDLVQRVQGAINPPVDGGSDHQEAQTALTAFYTYLNQGAYDLAAPLYGGSYDELEYFNPEIDPSDQLSLLQAGCEFNGLVCLPVRSAAVMDENAQGEFIFTVVFSNPDGSPFILGPCCGASEEEMPPVSEFVVRVNCAAAGSCQVLDLPPYVP